MISEPLKHDEMKFVHETVPPAPYSYRTRTEPDGFKVTEIYDANGEPICGFHRAFACMVDAFNLIHELGGIECVRACVEAVRKHKEIQDIDEVSSTGAFDAMLADADEALNKAAALLKGEENA